MEAITAVIKLVTIQRKTTIIKAITEAYQSSNGSNQSNNNKHSPRCASHLPSISGAENTQQTQETLKEVT